MKTVLVVGLLLGSMAAFFGAESALSDMFNRPVFPGEASMAIVLMLMLAVGYVKFLRWLEKKWKRKNEETIRDVEAHGDCGACSERGDVDGMQQHQPGERRD